MVRKVSLSKVQGVVGLVTGLMSIGGATLSALGFFTAGDEGGQIVAVVRDAGSDAPVRGAVVEVLTRENGLVTAMPESEDGVARRTVAPGAYRVRVLHPDYTEVSRDVHVQPDGVAEMHVKLERRGRERKPTGVRSGGAQRAGASPGQVVDHGVRVTRRMLGRIGF